MDGSVVVVMDVLQGVQQSDRRQRGVQPILEDSQCPCAETGDGVSGGVSRVLQVDQTLLHRQGRGGYGTVGDTAAAKATSNVIVNTELSSPLLG